MPLARLIREWEAEARRLQRSEPERASIFQHCSEALLAAICDWLTTEVTASEAARISALSARHIRRLIRQGRLTRYGGDGERLRVRLGELFCLRVR